MEFSSVLKKLRTQAGLTQNDLANNLGVHYQTVSKWERGLALPDLSILGDLARELNVSLDLLLGETQSENSVTGDFDSTKLAHSITAIRKGARLTQAEFADKVGVSSDTVSKWERGVIAPDIEKIVNMARAFSVAPSAIYYGAIKELGSGTVQIETKKSFPKKYLYAILCSAVAILFAVIAVVIFGGEDTPPPHVCEFVEQIVKEEYKKSDATCTVRAKYRYSCSCGIAGTESFEYGNVKEHDYANYVYNNDASCGVDGTESAYCTMGCGTSDTRAKLGTALTHSYTNYISDENATYESDGTKTATCDHGCGTTDTVVDVGSRLIHGHIHEYVQKVVDDDYFKSGATCTQKARYYFSCSCGHKGYDTFEWGDLLPHNYENYIYNNDASCGVDGTESAYCTMGCGTSDTRAKLGTALTHSYTNYISDGNATYESDGTKTATCDHGCGTTDTVVDEGSKLIPEHIHDYKQKTISGEYFKSGATCTQKARYYFSCSCGHKGYDTFEWGDLLPHNYENYIYNNDASCGVDGTESAYCTMGCGTSDTRAKLGTALTHSYTNYISDGNATYESDGTKTATCDHGCGTTDTVVDMGTMLVPNCISFNTLSVRGLNVMGKVSHATERFDFYEEITTSGASNYVVALDELGMHTVIMKTVDLQVGNNTFYIFESVDGELQNKYIVRIYRKALYTVTFQTSGSPISNQQVEEGSYALEPNAPTRTGYTFDGFNYDFSKPVTSDIVITAKWTANQYVVSFDINGGVDSFAPMTVTFGKMVTLPTPTTHQNGVWVFVGWYIGEEKVNGQFTWNVDRDLTLTAKWIEPDEEKAYVVKGSVIVGLTDYGMTLTDFIIPAKINGVEITGLVEPDYDREIYGLFEMNNTVRSVVFDKDSKITYLPDNTFFGASNLREVILPDGLQKIGWGVFTCTDLRTITIPANVKEMDGNVFYECKNLTDIYCEAPTIPMRWYDDWLYDCDATVHWANDYVGEQLFSIEDNVLMSTRNACSSMSVLTIPKVVNGEEIKKIERWAFYNCENVTELYFDGTVAEWNAIEKDPEWYASLRVTHVICSDGQVKIN